MAAANDIYKLAERTEDEDRKLAYMFPEYLFLNEDFTISLAGRSVEELLQYEYGYLRYKCINVISNENDLKSSLMIQISKDFFEWRSHSLRARDLSDVRVEICGFRISHRHYAVSPIAIRIRRSRDYLQTTASSEVDKLTYWIAHNLRGPVATLEGLINLARSPENNNELPTYLDYMSQQAERLDEKIQLMMGLARRIAK